MTFRVNHEMCISCGACEGTCPGGFQLRKGMSVVILDPVPVDLQDDAISAETGCPMGAISHE